MFARGTVSEEEATWWVWVSAGGLKHAASQVRVQMHRRGVPIRANNKKTGTRKACQAGGGVSFDKRCKSADQS